MKAPRYRTDWHRDTGEFLHGFAAVQQSLGVIWSTRVRTRLMLLEFGTDIRSRLGEDITPELALLLYADLVTAAHRWEPEYRINGLQLVRLTRTGKLALAHNGWYYPEGRFGNYAVREAATATPLPLTSVAANLQAAA